MATSNQGKNHYYAVIMAGGGGTRLWPLSRRSRPKQMLRLGSDRTLFQQAVDRLEGLYDPDHIYVVTIAEQAKQLQLQCPQVPVENYLLEPMPRGTASVVGLASIVIYRRDPEATLSVLTADHLIQNEKLFLQLLQAGYEIAQEKFLVTLGILPTYPATGYGYIQRGEELGTYLELNGFQVKRFREKPDLETAEKFIMDGDHFWNSGMFIWRADQILAEFREHMPQLNRILQWIYDVLGSEDEREVIETLWPAIKPETIDYGIMEKASRVAVIPAENLDWNDVGSWDSVDEVLPKDEFNNILIDAQFLGLDSDNMVICSDRTDRLICTINMHEHIIIDTGDALLVCPKKDAQRVKEMVALLKRTGLTQYV
ncbi:MAG: NTP transferase domain-containing protein [Anaerolineaceae bacterium]|nr:NTP transferase domain-containing protein [Anaerolineaceae bacterium]